MITISFELPGPDSPWRRTWDDARRGGAARLDEMELRYKFFAANVELIVDGVEFISRRRFVTLVDLALSISNVVKRVSNGGDASFGFTESEEVVRVTREGDLVSLSSSSRPEMVSLPVGRLIDECRDFLHSAYSRMVAEVPELGDNPVIQRILPEPLV